MLWRGPPCALHALSACRSLALGESGSSSRLAAARALVGLLGGPAGKRQAPEGARPLHRDARRQRPPPRLLCQRPAGGEVAQPRWLHPERRLQAAGGGSAGDGGRLGSWKDTGESAANNHPDPGQEDGKKPNKSQQLKKVFKEYGGVAVGFHVGISLMSLGMFYLAVSSGVDMTAILFRLGFDEAVVQSKLAAGTSTFLLAYAIHKLFAPVRISITLISVPLLVRYFRKIGFFKPPAPNP